MKLLKRIFSDSIIYGVSSYLSVVAAIFLTPIYTRILLKTDYGAMDIINTWISLVVAILPLGLLNAVVRFYPDFKADPEQRKKYLSAILGVLLMTGLSFLVLAYFVTDAFTRVFIGDESYNKVVLLGLLVIALTPIYSYQLQLLRVKMKKWLFLTVTVINFLILSVLGFVLVYYFSYGIEGFFYASVAGLSVGIVLGFLFNQERYTLFIEKRIIKELLSYSVHFLSVFLLMQLTFVIDRYLINRYFSLEANGVYSIANRIGSMVNIAVGAFGMAWMPYVFNLYKKDFAKELFRKVYELYLLVALILVSGILIFRAELIHFFAPDYKGALEAAGLLVIYHFVSGLAYVLTLGIHIGKKTSILTKSAIIAVTANVLSSLLFIQFMEIEGIALGSLVSAFVWIGIQYHFSERAYAIKPNLWWIGIILVVFMAIYFGVNFLGESTLFELFLLKMALFVLWSGALVLFIIRRFHSVRLDLSEF